LERPGNLKLSVSITTTIDFGKWVSKSILKTKEGRTEVKYSHLETNQEFSLFAKEIKFESEEVTNIMISATEKIGWFPT
jgi:hypothetical protein